jgi:hypothetical protein
LKKSEHEVIGQALRDFKGNKRKLQSISESAGQLCTANCGKWKKYRESNIIPMAGRASKYILMRRWRENCPSSLFAVASKSKNLKIVL